MAYEVLDNATAALYYEQGVQLDGIEYLLRFLWSPRENCWYLDVLDQDETPLAVGIKLVVGFPLLRRFSDPRLPPGVLICTDITGMLEEIQTSDELGNRVLLIYITEDEFEEFI